MPERPKQLVQRDTLIGREAELGVLTDLIDSTPYHGGALLVWGDAGIGKSTLLAAAAADARRRGFRVLGITGVQSEGLIPFAGLHQLLHPLLADAEVLPEGQRHALFAALGAERGPIPEPFLIALATLNLLAETAATAPLVIVVDDLHWLDAPTREALTFVARRMGSDPIVIIGAIRRGHVGPFASAGLPELEVRGLDDAAARAVLATSVVELERVDQDRILREAVGNPLALVELPGSWRATGRVSGDHDPDFLPLSARLERAFAGRIGELPDATRDAILVTAVESRGELPEILAAASALADRPLEVADLEPAENAGLLHFDERRVAFWHPLVRSGVLQSESVARRQAAHGALADVVTDDSYRRAWHRGQSIVGPDDDVADELEASHVTALSRGAVESAIRALERSADLTSESATRGRRLLLAAFLAYELGRPDLVDRLVTAASVHALSDLDRARTVWLREIFTDGVPGDATRVLDLCTVAQQANGAGDPDLALKLLLGAALRCWWAHTGESAQARVAEVLTELQGFERDPRFVATLAIAEPVRQATRVAELLAGVVLEEVQDADALRLYGQAAHAIGDEVRAADFLDRAETQLRGQGRLGILSHVLGAEAVVLLDLGDWQRAAAACEEGRRIARETGQPIWSDGPVVNDARLCGLRGESARAHELAAEAEHTPSLHGLNLFLACAQLARGYAYAGEGEYERAFAALSRVFDPQDPRYHEREQVSGLMMLTEAAVHAGRQDDARPIVTAMERLAATTPSPLLDIQLRYARAVLAADDEAEPLYLYALKADLVRWPWPRARIELAYGSWLRRQRRAVESRPLLRSAQATFEWIGAAPWLEQARAELRAAGERVAAQGPAAQDLLSAQELRIAILAAEGLSNREIGQRLFLSARTISSHLYRIFPKLDISSRRQLAARLQESQPVRR